MTSTPSIFPVIVKQEHHTCGGAGLVRHGSVGGGATGNRERRRLVAAVVCGGMGRRRRGAMVLNGRSTDGGGFTVSRSSVVVLDLDGFLDGSLVLDVDGAKMVLYFSMVLWFSISRWFSVGRPLVLIGRTSDFETLVLLSKLTVFFDVFLTSVGFVLVSAIMLGVAIVGCMISRSHRHRRSQRMRWHALAVSRRGCRRLWYNEASVSGVVVPDQALVLDWVFADGPPQNAIVYDNNHNQDFHAIVPMAAPDEQYWVEEEQLIYRKLQEERKLREEAMRTKAEKTARMKAETKEKTLKRFLLSQKHIVFTEPLDVQAGSTVTVFYNPSNTNLNGKPEVWFRCSFNRWSHRNGPLPPQRMFPAENGTHVKASVKVPLDAYVMDFVFSENENGGVFDNKFGMDYHIPVFGGIVKEPPLHIIHIAVEMAPIAKVGGLGDVVTSLSRAVQDLNHNVDIILPKYDCLNLSNVKDFQFHKNYFWAGTEIKVWHGKVEGLSVYFLEPQNGFFWVGCVYGRGNDAERFGFFCHAALEFLLQNGSHPDIIHCHDWSSAPVAWLFKDNYTNYGLSKARVVFTIHNLEFGAHFIAKAMAYADKATTVSPTYSREVAGNPAVAPNLYKFHGIINGIDPDIWDPYNDSFIPVPYTSDNVVEGKRASKEALQQKLGLKKADLPLVGVISRLTHQKGTHLIKHAIWHTLERGGQVVLLGSAPDPRVQNDFVNLANQLHSSHADRARLCLAYDEPLSHLIYAGADFILVPSIFEPCGLTQLTAMRYGSIPIVRKTGGLYDTVFDVDHDCDRAQAQGLEPNGFSFDGADVGGVDYALNRAISAWYEGRDWFNTLCKRVMEQDWSWNRPALDYLELYHAARKLE